MFGLEWLLFPAVMSGAVAFMAFYTSREGKRAKEIARAHLAKDEDIEAGYRAVAESMKALRKAKENEQNVLATNWVNEWNQIAPTPEDRWNLRPEYPKRSVRETTFILEDSQDPLLGAVSKYWMNTSSGKEEDDWSYSDRMIQSAGAFVRQAPTDLANYYGTLPGGERVHFDGWVWGKPINGNDIWFLYHGESSRRPKYVWSGATNQPSTTGLTDMNDYETEFIPDGNGNVVQVHVAPRS